MREDTLILQKKKVGNRILQPHDELGGSFFPALNTFLQRLQKDKSLYPKSTDKKSLTDPWGWILMFHGYRFDPKHEKMYCKDIFEQESPTLLLVEDEHDFYQKVKLLFTMFNFDIQSFYDVFRYQGDIIDIVKQVVQPKLFMGNRFHGNIANPYKTDPALVVYPNKYNEMEVPTLNYMCDGIDFPVNICKNTDNIKVERLKTGNFGDGDFVTIDGRVIDCMRIGDLWLTDKPLKQRLKFTSVAQAEEAMMLDLYSLGDIKKYGSLLDYDSKNGLLIRPLSQNFYRNYWFVLNEDSYYAAYADTHGNLSYNKTNDAAFFDMRDNKVGSCGIESEKLSKMVWLDNYDIDRFKSILMSGDGVFK